MSATSIVRNSGERLLLSCEVETEVEEKWCWTWRRLASFCASFLTASKSGAFRGFAAAVEGWGWDASRSRYVAFKRSWAAGDACGWFLRKVRISRVLVLDHLVRFRRSCSYLDNLLSKSRRTHASYRLAKKPLSSKRSSPTIRTLVIVVRCGNPSNLCRWASAARFEYSRSKCCWLQGWMWAPNIRFSRRRRSLCSSMPSMAACRMACSRM